MTGDVVGLKGGMKFRPYSVARASSASSGLLQRSLSVLVYLEGHDSGKINEEIMRLPATRYAYIDLSPASPS